MSDPIELIQKLLSEHQGIAFGEDHRSSELFQYLQQSAGTLRQLGVKTLFIEAIHSKDNVQLQTALEKGDREAVRSYLGTRSWSKELADDYTALVQKMHEQGIRIVGIDKPTGTQRFKEANPHWVSTIRDCLQQHPDEKYIILGGASHFGYTFGPGVNIDLGIPAVNFSIRPGIYADKEPAINAPTYYPSQEEFMGRQVADYTIALPRINEEKDISRWSTRVTDSGNGNIGRGSKRTDPKKREGGWAETE